MYCKHCGKATDNDYVFCVHCGKRVNPISSVVFKNHSHYDVINAYTVLSYCKSCEYLIGDLGVGFVILNKNKKLVIDTLFEDVITQDRGCVDSIWVKKNGKWGLVNPLTGIIICDFIYDDISQLEEDYNDENVVTVVYSNGLCGKIDSDGNIILPIIYDEISSRGRVKYQGLWGVVRNGEQIIPCEYIKLGDYNDSRDGDEPSQHKNGKWGLIGHLEFEYDEINLVADCYYEVRKGDKWGSLHYNEFIPCEYSLEEIKKKRRFN